MTSTNINKIVQSNINIKPWMLSKNTNQIVNTCIQKIYKQMPASFNKGGIKLNKVATSRVENKGPLRTFQSQERPSPLTTITPIAGPMKKSNTKLKPQVNNLMNSLKVSNKNNQQMASKFAGANLMPNKRLLKTPNYKIYKSRRFGSSASSSRSSLFRRYDERRRQRQNYPAQINYLIRSFHTNQFEPTYARYLMPVRNQQVEANLGSIPDAIKFSTNIQNDLMAIDTVTRNKVAFVGHKSNMKLAERNRLDVWNHPPSLSKFKINSSKDTAIKTVTSNAERGMRRARLTPEHRDYARINVLPTAQLKQHKPPNELFTAQHDRNRTELHEKHRRNRMKKLGLIESPTAPETETEECGESTKAALKPTENTNELSKSILQTKREMKYMCKASPTLCNQTETKPSQKVPTNLSLNTTPNKESKTNCSRSTKKEESKTNSSHSTKKENSNPIVSKKTNTSSANSLPSRDLTSLTSAALPQAYSITSPIAAARAQMQNRNNYRSSYRYNRADFFSTKKY